MPALPRRPAPSACSPWRAPDTRKA
jgi:hypothetical protein